MCYVSSKLLGVLIDYQLLLLYNFFPNFRLSRINQSLEAIASCHKFATLPINAVHKYIQDKANIPSSLLAPRANAVDAEDGDDPNDPVIKHCYIPRNTASRDQSTASHSAACSRGSVNEVWLALTPALRQRSRLLCSVNQLLHLLCHIEWDVRHT